MRTMLLFVFLFVFCQKTNAETFIFSESYRTFKSASTDSQANTVWAQQSLSKHTGLFGWGQVGMNYRQTYVGGYVKPTNWLQVGVGGGVEQTTSKARIGSFLYANKGRCYVFAIYEDKGATGYWYLTLTDVKISKRWSVGTHSQAFLGHGVRTEYRLNPIGRWTPSIRPTITWDEKGHTNAMLGLRFTYFKGE